MINDSKEDTKKWATYCGEKTKQAGAALLSLMCDQLIVQDGEVLLP
jgi:hypothetical protein